METNNLEALFLQFHDEGMSFNRREMVFTAYQFMLVSFWQIKSSIWGLRIHKEKEASAGNVEEWFLGVL